jgi:hypothetical protein
LLKFPFLAGTLFASVKRKKDFSGHFFHNPFLSFEFPQTSQIIIDSPIPHLYHSPCPTNVYGRTGTTDLLGFAGTRWQGLDSVDGSTHCPNHFGLAASSGGKRPGHAVVTSTRRSQPAEENGSKAGGKFPNAYGFVS